MDTGDRARDLKVALGGDLEVSLVPLDHDDRFPEPLHQHGIVGRAVKIPRRIRPSKQFDLEELRCLHPPESLALDRRLDPASRNTGAR